MSEFLFKHITSAFYYCLDVELLEFKFENASFFFLHGKDFSPG